MDALRTAFRERRDRLLALENLELDEDEVRRRGRQWGRWT